MSYVMKPENQPVTDQPHRLEASLVFPGLGEVCSGCWISTTKGHAHEGDREITAS